MLINSSEVVGLLGAQTSDGATQAQAENEAVAALDAWAGASGQTGSALIRVAPARMAPARVAPARVALARVAPAGASRLAAHADASTASRVSASTGASLLGASESLLWQVLALDAIRPSTHDGRYAKVIAPHTPSIPSGLFAESAVGRAEHAVVATILEAQSVGSALAETLDRLASAQARDKRSAALAQQQAAGRYLRSLGTLLGSLPAAETRLAGLLKQEGLGAVTLTAAELRGWHGVPAGIRRALDAVGAGSLAKQLNTDVSALQPGVYDFADSVDNAQLLEATRAAAAALKHDAGITPKPGDRL